MFTGGTESAARSEKAPRRTRPRSPSAPAAEPGDRRGRCPMPNVAAQAGRLDQNLLSAGRDVRRLCAVDATVHPTSWSAVTAASPSSAPVRRRACAASPRFRPAEWIPRAAKPTLQPTTAGSSWATADASNPRIQPPVVDPDPDGPVIEQRIFGPIPQQWSPSNLWTTRFRFVKTRSPEAHQAYLFTKSRAVRERVIRRCRRGGMIVNIGFSRCRRPEAAVRWYRRIGHGCHHGRWGFEEFSHRSRC